MAVTPVGNPYVESSDNVADYPGASEALAERIDIVGVNPFADAAARDAAIPSPVQGQMCSLNDDNKGYRYDGSAWVLFSGAGPANFTNAATGDYVSDGISYKYITFTGSGELVVDQAGFADILIIGGGGGGGNNGGGGGGAGGVAVITNAYLPVGTLTVRVGAGGLGFVGGQNYTGFSGNSSLVGPYAAPGGGGGAGYGQIGDNGGSGGGGAGASAKIGGSGLTGQGFAGGTGFATGSLGAGGGGGGGAVGANATSTTGGNGGSGLVGNLFTGLPLNYAGGGGGGVYNAGTPGTATQGGGAGEDASAAGIAGTANTGGGGGGGGGPSNGAGGAGGSGVVIVRVVV